MIGPVAIICGAGIVSGKEIMALELGLGLREMGTEVHYLTSRWGSGEFGRRAGDMAFAVRRTWLGFVSVTLRWGPIWMTLDQIRRWPALMRDYRRFLNDVKPAKIIHTNWHHVLLLWPFLRATRDIYWSHEVIPGTWQYRTLFSLLENCFGTFIAVSKAVAQSLVCAGVSKKKVEVIYNGIADPIDHTSSENEEQTLPVNVGIVAQVAPWKGHEDLFDAFARVSNGMHNLQLYIFGVGLPAYETILRNKAHELGIENRVFWRGFVADRAMIYEMLNVLVVPSRSDDPLPTVAIEAGFFSLPVIASRRGGLPEIIEDGVTGLLFGAGDIDEFAQALSKLIADVELRQRMGEKARERAVALFSRERFVREFSDLISHCEIVET